MVVLSSLQFSRSVVSNSLRPHELQHTRPPYPSPTPGVHSNSRPSSQWCLHWSLRKAFLYLLAILWNSAFKWVYLSFCALLFACLLFTPFCKPFRFFAFLFLGDGLVPCLMYNITNLDETNHTVWGHPRRTGHDGEVWQMWSTGEGNGKPLQYSCLENPMNSMKRQKDRTLKDELPRSGGAQYATEDQWRNNSRKNEGMEPKQNNTQLWMWLVIEARSDAGKRSIA